MKLLAALQTAKSAVFNLARIVVAKAMAPQVTSNARFPGAMKGLLQIGPEFLSRSLRMNLLVGPEISEASLGRSVAHYL